MDFRTRKDLPSTPPSLGEPVLFASVAADIISLGTGSGKPTRAGSGTGKGAEAASGTGESVRKTIGAPGTGVA